MTGRLRARVPRLDSALAGAFLNSAWDEIRRKGSWSFQIATGALSIPNPIVAGAVTLTTGSAIVTGDAAASGAWASSSILPTTLQFRAGGVAGNSVIYDVTAMDGATLTLSSPYFPIAGATVDGSYALYQPWIVAPCADFRSWLSVLDYADAVSLDVRADRRGFNVMDPQRISGLFPLALAPLGADNRPGSATFGWQRYELWPNPQTTYSYQIWYKRIGADLVNPADTLPSAIPESMVEELASAKAYRWAEAVKDPRYPSGAASDMRFLAEAALAAYERMEDEVRLNDRASADLMSKKIPTGVRSGFVPYSLPDGQVMGVTR